jgi:small-conductance mechanosensitive channel
MARRLERDLERVEPLRLRGVEVLSAEKVHRYLHGLRQILVVVAGILILLPALPIIFIQFPATRGAVHDILVWIYDPLHSFALGALHLLPNVFSIIVILLLMRLALRFLSSITDLADRGTLSLEPWIHADLVRPTFQLLKFAVVILTMFFIAPLIPGTGTAAAKGISIVLGLMVSFGSTSTVGNLIAGVVLVYMRPFRMRDRVKIGPDMGDVIERTFLYTRLRTSKNEEILVPSLQALSGTIVNYSSQGRVGQLILHTSVTIGYDAPWRTVHALLLQAAQRTTLVLQEPKTFILQTSLDDFYVTYELNCYTDRPQQMSRIYSELHQNIQDAFNEGGIEIMSPHYAQLRDGNATTIPSNYVAKDYKPPRFRVDVRTDAAQEEK